MGLHSTVVAVRSHLIASNRYPIQTNLKKRGGEFNVRRIFKRQSLWLMPVAFRYSNNIFRILSPSFDSAFPCFYSHMGFIHGEESWPAVVPTCIISPA